jgi:hypothetical protein
MVRRGHSRPIGACRASMEILRPPLTGRNEPVNERPAAIRHRFVGGSCGRERMMSKTVFFVPKPARFASKIARFTPSDTLPKWVKCPPVSPFRPKKPPKT